MSKQYETWKRFIEDDDHSKSLNNNWASMASLIKPKNSTLVNIDKIERFPTVIMISINPLSLDIKETFKHVVHGEFSFESNTVTSAIAGFEDAAVPVLFNTNSDVFAYTQKLYTASITDFLNIDFDEDNWCNIEPCKANGNDKNHVASFFLLPPFLNYHILDLKEPKAKKVLRNIITSIRIKYEHETKEFIIDHIKPMENVLHLLWLVSSKKPVITTLTINLMSVQGNSLAHKWYKCEVTNWLTPINHQILKKAKKDSVTDTSREDSITEESLKAALTLIKNSKNGNYNDNDNDNEGMTKFKKLNSSVKKAILAASSINFPFPKNLQTDS